MGSPEGETPPPGEFGDQSGKRGGEDVGKSLDRYSTAKAHTLRFLDSLGLERSLSLGLRWSAIRECGDYLKFRDYFRVGQVKLSAANFCKNHLTCGLCAIRRGARGLAVYLERVEQLPGFGVDVVPYLVTHTVLNGNDLGERLAHLLKSHRKLLHRRHLARGSAIAPVLGGVYSVEVTNRGNGWHPHMHSVWLAPPDAVDMHRLRDEWHGITGDSFEVDVRPVVALDDVPSGVSPYAAGFAEVFKYATKPAELGADLFEQAYPVLRGKRLLGSFGCLWGVKVPDSLADDLSGLEEEPYVEFLARFVAGRYRMSTTGEVCCDA